MTFGLRIGFFCSNERSKAVIEILQTNRSLDEIQLAKQALPVAGLYHARISRSKLNTARNLHTVESKHRENVPVDLYRSDTS